MTFWAITTVLDSSFKKIFQMVKNNLRCNGMSLWHPSWWLFWYKSWYYQALGYKEQKFQKEPGLLSIPMLLQHPNALQKAQTPQNHSSNPLGYGALQLLKTAHRMLRKGERKGMNHTLVCLEQTDRPACTIVSITKVLPFFSAFSSPPNC